MVRVIYSYFISVVGHRNSLDRNLHTSKLYRQLLNSAQNTFSFIGVTTAYVEDYYFLNMWLQFTADRSKSGV